MQQMCVELNELQSELEVYALIKSIKFSYHLYVYNGNSLELLLERLPNPKQEEKAKEKPNASQLKKKSCRHQKKNNLAMILLNNMFKTPD